MSELEPRGPEGPAPSGEEDVFFVALQFKGTTYEVPVQPEDLATTIFDFVQEVLDFPQENCKLIFKGRVVRIDDASQTVADLGLAARSKVMLMATSSHDVAFVRNSRADPLVKGFEEEERDERNRRKRAKAAGASAWGTKQDQEYRFGSIKAEFKYSTPPPYEAERLLQRLATDPGIIDIMKSRHFKVGVFTEMSPVEAQERMAKRGTPNMDLLGYNQNAGDMIVLRLRTDNMKGFRPYPDLINTLIHELTHNVWGPHDQNFWKLFGELKAQYMRFHRFWSHNGKSADGDAGGQFAGFSSGAGDDEDASGGGFGRTLGGGDAAMPVSEAERRERALLAAEARKVTAELPKPNFLAGNGTWVIMCPCGQMHDPADCPTGAAASSASKADMEEDDDEVEAGLGEKAGTEVEQLPDMLGSQDVATVGEPDESAGRESIPQLLSGNMDASASTAAIQASGQMSTDLGSLARPEHDVVAVASGAQERPTAGYHGGLDSDESMPAALQPSEKPPLPAPELTASELESLGLDGTAVWMQKFNEQLRLFRDTTEQRRPGLRLMRKLVGNIVASPGEPKFRRIRADNPRVRTDLLASPGATEAAEALLRLLGFDVAAESGDRVYELKDAKLDPVRLRLGQELLETLDADLGGG